MVKSTMTQEQREAAKASFHKYLEEHPDVKEKFLKMREESRELLADIKKDHEKLLDIITESRAK